MTAYVGSDGVLEFGIKNIKTGGCWYVLDNAATAKYVAKPGAYDNTQNIVLGADFKGAANENFPGFTIEANGGNRWKNGDHNVEYWNGTAANGQFKYYQDLSGIPNGKYKVEASMFNSLDNQAGPFTAGGQAGAFVTSNNNSYWALCSVEGKTLNTYSTEALVTNNTAQVGIGNKETMTARWFVCDYVKMYFVEPALSEYAIASTGETSATADTWYKYEVTISGNYNITSSANTTFTYTKNYLASQETSSTHLTAGTPSQLELTAGTYYFKTSAVGNITIAANSMSYNVGSATANMAYAQPGQTVTITYADATTNDGAASFAKKGAPTITFGTESVTTTATANGFTFVVPNNVTAGNDYTLAIPAGAFGYAAGNTYNEAQNITIKTPAIYDGTYYFKNTQSQKYLSRGMEYGTEAIVDDFGLAVILRTDADGNTTFRFFDNQLFIGNQGWAYGDYGTPMKFLASKTGDGYEFRNMDKNNANTEFLAQVIENKVVTDARKGDNLYGTSNVWTIETVEQHKANYTRNADNQAKAAAEAAGINASTAEALETVLASYTEKPVTITGAKAEKFQQYASDAQTLKENEYYKEVVENLTPGIYKLTVDAYQRAAHNDWVADNGGARGLIYLYANGAKTQLKSVFEYGADAAYSNDFARDGKHYPNGQGAGYDALETGNYQNVVYVYVPADNGKTTGTLTIGINNPVRQANGDAGKTATWALYNNWNLTLYSADPFNEVVDGVRSYYGKYVSGLEIELTNEVPTVDLTNATISGTVTVTPTNRNGLVYAKAGQNISGVENNIVVDGKCTNLVLTDGGTFKAHKTFEATNASYNMTAVAGDKFGTLMLPFAVSTKPAECNVYVLDKGITFGEELQASATNAIAANTPVLVTKARTYSASNVQVAATNDTYTNGELVGTYKAKTAEEGTFVLQNHSGRVAFYIVKGSTPTVNPFRAYIKSQSAGVAPRYISVNFGDETGIEDMEIATGENVIYDLSGRKVVKAEKGLYIVNGKKVLVK